MSAARSGRIIAAVSPVVPLVIGLISLAIGFFIRPSLGPRYRVGLLLASSPRVSIAEAKAMAGGPPRYVQVSGRVDSETDFEDDAHRPLVFRRTRLQRKSGSTWIDIDDRRERVPFELREGLDSIALDDRELDAGLVVVVRESVGTAEDVADRVPAGIDPRTPIRLRVEQVSSVEHAIAVGVPRLEEDGTATLSAGLGRPLILATMDRADALRVVADGRPAQPVLLAASLIGGAVLVAVGLVWALVAAVW
jgi:hypothetical protein